MTDALIVLGGIIATMVVVFGTTGWLANRLLDFVERRLDG